MSTKKTESEAVSPSIHEAVVARHFATDPRTREPIPDETIEALRDAVQSARHSAEKARRIAAAIHGNEMMTVPARHRKAREETWRATEPALRRLDAALARARRDRDALDAATAAPPRPTDAVGSLLAGEIRTRLAAMNPKQRSAALEAALADGDDTVLGAVLVGPPMLSGIGSRAEHDMLRIRWRRARHGADLDRLERIGRALDDTERVGSLMVAMTARFADSDVIARAEAAEERVRQAIAD